MRVLPVAGTFLVAVLLSAGPAQAESVYDIDWSVQIGTVSIQERAQAVATDPAGDVYVSGYTTASLFPDYVGNFDAFTAKYDPAGNLVWGRQFGSDLSDFGYAVAADAAGNVYAGGNWQGDAFVRRLDSSGNETWTRTFGTPYYVGGAVNGLATDSLGNAYAVGIEARPENPTAALAFLRKYDSSGNLLLDKTVPGSTAKSVAVDTAGRAYVVSDFQSDAQLHQFDVAGNLVWSRTIGTSESEAGLNVALDAAGNAYVVGITEGDLVGSPLGSRDAFLVKYDADGNQLWLRQIGTEQFDEGYGVTVDPSGDVFISGRTYADLDGEQMTRLDAFLAKYDSDGNPIWDRHFGGTLHDGSLSLAADSGGNIFSAGFSGAGLPNLYGHASLVKFAPVPEPTSITLAVFALAALAACCRSRRKVRSCCG